jgi:regulator of replication initiation timing
MSEELKVEVQPEVKEEVKQEPEVEQSQQSESDVLDVEAQARELGWKPKEEFYADPKNKNKPWRTAEDFLDRKSFFDKIESQAHKIDSQAREIRELKKGMQALAEHNRRIGQLAYEKALRELKEERDRAIEEQDLKKVEEIRDKMESLKENQRRIELEALKEQQTKQEPNEQFAKWVEQNKWYTQDNDMRVFADGYAMHLWNSGIRDPNEALPMIEKKVKETFPNKFRNPNKDRAPTIEGGSRKDVKKPDNFTLTEEEEKILNTMLRAGAPITREEYIKQLKEYRG